VAGGIVVTERRAPSVFTDLFGNPLPQPERPPASEAKSTTAAASLASSSPASSASADDPPPPRGLTTEDIESFKALNVEVCFRTERTLTPISGTAPGMGPRSLRHASATAQKRSACPRPTSYLNAADAKSVRKTVAGLLVLLHPDKEFTRDELREYLELAIEGRRRVKEQLKKMGSFEYHQVSFSYLDNETREEHFVGVPEEGGRDRIAQDPLPPGCVYSAAVTAEDKIALHRVEVTRIPGRGKLTPVGEPRQGHAGQRDHVLRLSARQESIGEYSIAPSSRSASGASTPRRSTSTASTTPDGLPRRPNTCGPRYGHGGAMADGGCVRPHLLGGRAEPRAERDGEACHEPDERRSCGPVASIAAVARAPGPPVPSFFT
jgi:ATP-dependent Lon protease